MACNYSDRKMFRKKKLKLMISITVGLLAITLLLVGSSFYFSGINENEVDHDT
jgi:hypothetical protein